jgi:acetyl esterase/lipase
VEEQRGTYKGRNIVVRNVAAEAMPERIITDAAEPALSIDDEAVVTVRDSAGMYIAAGFAYAPQTSLTDLAQRIIDYRDATQQGDEHERPQEPSEPDGG